MRLDVIVITPKKKCKKIIGIITIILAILLIILYFVNNIYLNVENKDYEQDILGVTQTKVEKQDSIQQEKSGPRTPIYTLESKNNIQNIYNIGEKNAYITFDDGPSKEVTPYILDILKQYNIKATFFVLGSRVDFYPDIVKRAYNEGHFIANHGYSHIYKNLYANTSAVIDEYNRTEQCIRNAIENQEYSSHLFRFPGGSQGGSYHKIKADIANILLTNNISYIDWNCLTNDSNGAKTPQEIMMNLELTSLDKNNLVVLMHDAGDKQLTYQMLPEVLTYLKDKGYTFKNFYEYM